MADELEPDVIIAAVGSKPLVPAIPGINGSNVISAEDLYASPAKAGKKVIVLGGGLVGSELAIYLGDRGHDVTIIEMLTHLNAGDNNLQGQAIGLQIDRLGIKTLLGTKVVEIGESGVLGENTDGQQTLYQADTIVCALGRQPSWREADELRFCAPEFHQLGDCLAARNIFEATRTAHHIALDIGER